MASPSAGVTYEDDAAPLGFANKSSVARLLVKERMCLEDTIKLMILCKTQKITIQKIFRCIWWWEC